MKTGTVSHFVHCNQHGRPHEVKEDGSCWCGCVEDSKEGKHGRYATVLESAKDMTEAYDECRQRGLWLYGEDK